MFSLTLENNEATYLCPAEAKARVERIQGAYSREGLARLKKRTDDYISGRGDLTALDFYLAFEQASVLVLLHAFPRRGERNRHANGLQQTYGDHVRLMMLGFDKFDRSDIGWLMNRRRAGAFDLGRDELEACLQRYHDLELSRPERVAIWIASALHDYGKVYRRGYGLDAEDAAPLCAELVEILSPEGMVEFIHYGIRNHDLIEHVITGDTPVNFIKEPLAHLPQGLQERAMPMLALIQQIGAASLGEGRLTKAKLDIYNACLSGEIVSDDSLEVRLGRLLFGAQAIPDPSTASKARAVFDGLENADRSLLTRLLERTVLLGWNPLRNTILKEEADQAKSLQRLVASLLMIGGLWDRDAKTHVVVARPWEFVKCTRADGDTARLNNEDAETELLNGMTALILR